MCITPLAFLDWPDRLRFCGRAAVARVDMALMRQSQCGWIQCWEDPGTPQHVPTQRSEQSSPETPGFPLQGGSDLRCSFPPLIFTQGYMSILEQMAIHVPLWGAGFCPHFVTGDGRVCLGACWPSPAAPPQLWLGSTCQGGLSE